MYDHYKSQIDGYDSTLEVHVRIYTSMINLRSKSASIGAHVSAGCDQSNLNNFLLLCDPDSMKRSFKRGKEVSLSN